MVGVCEIDSGGYESESHMKFRHNSLVNKTADYSRWISAIAAGAGLAAESQRAFVTAKSIYAGASIVQIVKGYLFRNREDYVMTTVLRDCLAAFSGFLGASWLSGESSVRGVGIERFALIESLSSLASLSGHLASRRDLRKLENIMLEKNLEQEA